MNSTGQAIPINFYEHISRNGCTVQGWQPVADYLETSAPITELRLVTWNVWFDELQKRCRFEGFLKELLSVQPVDVVSLQEVTPEFLGFLQADVNIRAEWVMTDCWDSSHLREVRPNSCGCIFLLKKKWAGNVRAWVRRFPTSKMRRYVIMAEIFQGGKSIVHCLACL